MRPRFSFILAGLVCAVAMTLVPAASLRSATITADGTTCTLTQAVVAANFNFAVLGCPAGDDTDAGGDIIELTYDVTLATAASYSAGYNGLPEISSKITINGNGHIIQRDPSLFADPSDPCSGIGQIFDPRVFRIMAVTFGGNLTLNDATVRHGCSPVGGAGIFVAGVNLPYPGTILTLNRSIVTQNRAPQGGGIWNYVRAMTTSENSTIADNSADNGGGGIYNQGDSLTLSSSAVVGNSAGGNGGGLANSGNATIRSSTFARNSAFYPGAGVIHGNGVLSVTNSTFAENTSASGGGIASVATVELANTLLDNATGGNCASFGPNAFTSQGHNLATDGTCGLTATGDQENVVDPRLDVLTDAGTAGKGHYPLLPGSPAIDWADNSLCTGPLLTDQLGQPRADGDGNGIVVCDIGSIEFQGKSLTALSPAKLWVGLKNSDDVGIRFDLKADIYKNTTLIGSGGLSSVGGGSSGFNRAQLDSIPLSLTSGPVAVFPDQTLSIVVSVRNACSGSGKNSGTARFWYNGQAIDTGASRDAGSRFDATIGTSTENYFLRAGSALSTTAGSSKTSVDVSAGAKCSAFKPFGSWIMTLP